MTARIAHIAAGIAALLLAAPAGSADVTKVRVGQHPTFTRIVFELDVPSGYRVAKVTNPDGSTDVVVTLDASAEARQLKSGSSLIRGVTVDAGTGRSVARIHLRDASLPLKEMILRDPARIVLDVMGEDRALAKARAAKPKPKAAAAQPSEAKPELAARPLAPKSQPKAKPALPPTQSAEPTPKPEPAPTVVAQLQPTPKPAPTRTAQPTAKRGTPKPVVAQALAPEPVQAKPSEIPTRDGAAQHAARAAMEKRLAAVREAKEQRMREAEDARQARARQQPKPAAAPERETTPARPAPPKESADPGIGFDPIMAGAIAGGILVVLVVVMMLRRRRSLPKNLDVTTLAADEPGDDERILAAGFSMDTAEPEPAEVADKSGADMVTGVTERNEPPLAAPGLFDEAEKGDSAMDQGIDFGAETMSQAPAQPSMGATPDVSAMLAEFERRIAQLEGRLDEAVEARERLERQVAAQSEELRVQRAAIARTQRALRGMSRSEEEQATEPALRDPS